ncbi:MAG: nitrogen fixation protein NifQ [Methylocystis sp.]|uniref:nitrogen fixation protein NifQ n=1 Tax=Methylocystis sp. TaxID=1911079 RepID=UPI003DA5F550
MLTLAPKHEQRGGAPTAPSPQEIYDKIVSRPTNLARADPFTAHILACALTMALMETRTHGVDVAAAVGLDRATLDVLTRQWIPAARDLFDVDGQAATIVRDEEEEQLHELLTRHRTDTSPLCSWITSIVVRRAMSPSHLWQDIGLLDRSELTRLMARWFPALAAANVDNMKWKKFFYRQLCELEGFSLCAAPTCRECGDFDACFGQEDGESALARLSRR